jgi:hypothetical protein
VPKVLYQIILSKAGGSHTAEAVSPSAAAISEADHPKKQTVIRQ